MGSILVKGCPMDYKSFKEWWADFTSEQPHRRNKAWAFKKRNGVETYGYCSEFRVIWIDGTEYYTFNAKTKSGEWRKRIDWRIAE